MRVLIFGAGLFFLAFTVHWIWWRLRPPSSSIRVLIAVFFGTLAAVLAASRLVPPSLPFLIHGFWEHLQVIAFHTALSLSYIVLYSAVEEDSPSAAMVKFVSLAGDEGRAKEDFNRLISNDLLIGSRLAALVDGGLAVHEGGRYRLTRPGLFWEGVFSLWKRILNLPRGG